MNDVGRHEVVLKLVSVSDQKCWQLAHSDWRSGPGMIKIQVPDYPEQTAKAGELFRMSLGDRPLTTLPRAVRIRVSPESPRGVVLDLQKPELTWSVPADVSGRIEIRIIAEPAFPDVEFSRDSKLDTRIIINVQPGAAVKSVPAEAEVDAEEARFRELFSREFAQLRTVTQRQELAYQLLERAIGLPDGPQHFALLNLAEEQSERARSTELLLEIHRLRAQRYGVDELTSGLEALESFRRSSVSGVQADIVVEQTVRLAKLAVEQDRWKDVAAVLEPAAQLMRNSSGLEKVLAADLDQVRKVSEQVSSGSLAVDDLTVQEAERLLAKWQFAPLFDQPSTLAFLQAGTNPTNTAGDGRERWTITSDRFHLTGKDQGVLTGFLESARESDRYVIRFHAAPGTNALQFVFGASPSQQLDGYILTLDPTGMERFRNCLEDLLLLMLPTYRCRRRHMAVSWRSQLMDSRFLHESMELRLRTSGFRSCEQGELAYWRLCRDQPRDRAVIFEGLAS